jgi:hypothetical protein
VANGIPASETITSQVSPDDTSQNPLHVDIMPVWIGVGVLTPSPVLVLATVVVVDACVVVVLLADPKST